MKQSEGFYRIYVYKKLLENLFTFSNTMILECYHYEDLKETSYLYKMLCKYPTFKKTHLECMNFDLKFLMLILKSKF